MKGHRKATCRKGTSWCPQRCQGQQSRGSETHRPGGLGPSSASAKPVEVCSRTGRDWDLLGVAACSEVPVGTWWGGAGLVGERAVAGRRPWGKRLTSGPGACCWGGRQAPRQTVLQFRCTMEDFGRPFSCILAHRIRKCHFCFVLFLIN